MVSVGYLAVAVYVLGKKQLSAAASDSVDQRQKQKAGERADPEAAYKASDRIKEEGKQLELSDEKDKPKMIAFPIRQGS